MALEVRGITKKFGVGNKRRTILQRFSMKVEDGEMVAVVGKKRSGKTALMNILSCMSRPDSGTYYVDGKPVHPWNPFATAMLRSRKFGVISKEPLLIPDMTVYENILLPLGHRLMTQKTKTKKAKDLLRSLGMKGKGKYYPHELSELEQQKVCAARAMIAEPKYIFADEPTACLCSSDVDRFLDFLEVLNSAGYTIIIATHSKRVASRCHRMIPITGQEPGAGVAVAEHGTESGGMSAKGNEGASGIDIAGNATVVSEQDYETKETGALRPGGGVASSGQQTGVSVDEEEEAYLRGIEHEDALTGEGVAESEQPEVSREELESKIRANLSAMGMEGKIPVRKPVEVAQEASEAAKAEVEMVEVITNTGDLALSDIMEEELERSLQVNVEHWM